MEAQAASSEAPSRIEALAARPALAALAGALTIAFSAILVDLAHVSPSTAAVFRCAYALPVLGAFAWAERRRHGPPPAGTWWRAVAAGTFFAADLILWHHAIADVGAGLATVLANLQVVLVAVAAWLLLAEKPSAHVAIAVTLVAIAAGAALGELDLAPSWPAHGWLVTLALTSQVLGWLLIALALPRLPASMTSVVLTVQPVGSVLLGIVLLGEEPAAVQLAGVALIVAGIVVATRKGSAPDV